MNHKRFVCNAEHPITKAFNKLVEGYAGVITDNDRELIDAIMENLPAEARQAEVYPIAVSTIVQSLVTTAFKIVDNVADSIGRDRNDFGKELVMLAIEAEIGTRDINNRKGNVQ